MLGVFLSKYICVSGIEQILSAGQRLEEAHTSTDPSSFAVDPRNLDLPEGKPSRIESAPAQAKHKLENVVLVLLSNGRVYSDFSKSFSRR